MWNFFRSVSFTSISQTCLTRCHSTQTHHSVIRIYATCARSSYLERILQRSRKEYVLVLHVTYPYKPLFSSSGLGKTLNVVLVLRPTLHLSLLPTHHISYRKHFNQAGKISYSSLGIELAKYKFVTGFWTWIWN